MIEWFARNPVAANLLMIGIVIAGVVSAKTSIPMEVFPSFISDRISVSTQFRGATPKSVEDGITTRVEQAIYDLEGISKIYGQSSEGTSTVVAEIDSGFDRREILNDIKLRVDALNTLPTAAEKPVVSINQRNSGVIFVAVVADPAYNVNAKSLRQAADKVRADLLTDPAITTVEFDGTANYEISISIAPEVLDSYNLTLAEVGQRIREGSADISAGNIQSLAGDILVRAAGQAYDAQAYARIPILTSGTGQPIRLGEIATISDGFEETPLITQFDGKPVVMLEVLRVGDQSAIEVADAVHRYFDKSQGTLPQGIALQFWDDDAVLVKARLSTLLSSGIQGGVLVLILLSLFLRPAVAFWVFLGVPVSFMGALIFMPFVGGTFNMVSLFAFITVLGIVVDDAIVTGENIYRRMRDGEDSLTAAIVGTKQIALPVTFGIFTTVVAFSPLADMGNNRQGFLAAQIPMVVIPVLLMSLIESKFVLPAHLSHLKPRNDQQRANFLSRIQMRISRGFEEAIDRYYQPFLARCLDNKLVTVCLLLGVSAVVVASAQLGHVRFTLWPRVQSEEIRFSLEMPDTTGFATTHKHIQSITKSVQLLQEKYRNPETGVSIIRHVFSTSGSSGRVNKASVGRVSVEIIPPPERHVEITATELGREVRNMVGEIPGMQKFSVRAETGGGVSPIDVELSGPDFKRMGAVVELVREKLKEFPSVYDIQDNYFGGKEELNIELKPAAYALGLSLADVAEQVRNGVFGFQAQRIQKGRNEIRVMVRYPLEYRSAIEDLTQLPIRVRNSDTEVPLADIAEFSTGSSPTTLFRLDRKGILNVTADIDKDIADMSAIMRDLELFMQDVKQSYPDVGYAFKGEAEEQAESNSNIASGSFIVLIAIYALLAIPFKSYGQPFIVMSVIPFGIVGAILGHILLQRDLSFLSIVGMLALAGVVVNDSLVLVDTINQRRKAGMTVYQAVVTSGAIRFRPVLLTSLTTFAGLTPLLLDFSTQAEFLKQMAISLGFGILFATAITLIIVPINYMLAYQLKHVLLNFWHGKDHPKRVIIANQITESKA
ncbi:efflux RND transporter permease subunit [Arenicella xantha]|uniref:Multidrug efflux pump subunit AcrB n=1 Tax=Arenicella xantha TaxID=644221 RepID=A0A395JHS4_9GAMM|nr:efflux RND transporter permease subunit [Arenicella xantha]RBP49690.1 multidrug efflux pump subunit AcrB [Arenicella xantha]